MPKVSVIMPLYNAEMYVKKAIDSIINQTFTDFELIIVNDRCTDKTVNIVENIHDSRIHLYHNEINRGIAYTRNRAIELAQGEYIALMDDDDVADLSRLEIEVAYLDEHRDIDVVGGRYCEIDENDKVKWVFEEPLNNPNYINAYLMLYNAMANGSTMIRNDFIKNNDIKYTDNCYGMEDYKFWIDCSLNGKITNINKIFLYWRDSLNNETSRVCNEKVELRKQKFSELHRYAFDKNGYKLTEEEYEIINKMFPAAISSVIASKRELEMLYEIMRKIINQAKSMNVKNEQEIRSFCRRMFATKTKFSELWF